MHLVCFGIIVILEWGMSKLPGFLPTVILLPILLFLLMQLLSLKWKAGLQWWALLAFFPVSIMLIDLVRQLMRYVTNGIPCSLAQFNETLVWAAGIGLLQYGVFYLCHGIWRLIQKRTAGE